MTYGVLADGRFPQAFVPLLSCAAYTVQYVLLDDTYVKYTTISGGASSLLKAWSYDDSFCKSMR